MDEQGLKQQIKDNTLSGAYLFYGDEDYLKELYVNKFLQKAAIDVNEKGTEAVAVTVAGIDATSPGINPDRKKGYFYCDTPFVYLIEETSSGAIFFIGTFRGE